MKEKDLICRYIWNGAEGGKSYMELFPKPEEYNEVNVG